MREESFAIQISKLVQLLQCDYLIGLSSRLNKRVIIEICSGKILWP